MLNSKRITDANCSGFRYSNFGLVVVEIFYFQMRYWYLSHTITLHEKCFIDFQTHQNYIEIKIEKQSLKLLSRKYCLHETFPLVNFPVRP